MLDTSYSADNDDGSVFSPLRVRTSNGLPSAEVATVLLPSLHGVLDDAAEAKVASPAQPIGSRVWGEKTTRL
jgi:hypothetical protein